MFPLAPTKVRLELLRTTWQRYAFALVATLVAAVVPHLVRPAAELQRTPLLAAFTAVLATAAVAGFGPSIVALFLGAGWGLFELFSTPGFSPSDIRVRLFVFLLEAVLVTMYGWSARRVNRRIAEASAWHQRLVETAAEGIWVLGIDDTIHWANPHMAEILRCPLGRLVGRLREEFVFPEDSAADRVRLQNLRNGQSEQRDRRLRRADGSEVWLLASSRPILNPEGQFQGVLSMMTDITERKHAETALRRSEARFRNLFENIVEGVYQSTPDGRILAANPMLLNMLGLTSEAELNDINIADHLYVDKTVRKHLLERLERDGSFRNVAYQLRRCDGRIITVEENARAVRDDGGQILYYEGTLTDISDQN